MSDSIIPHEQEENIAPHSTSLLLPLLLICDLCETFATFAGNALAVALVFPEAIPAGNLLPAHQPQNQTPPPPQIHNRN